MARGRCVAMVIGMLAFAACGEPSPYDAGRLDVAPPPVDAATFCTQVMTALDADHCGYRGRCCTFAERDRLGPAHFDWPVAWSCADPLDARIATCTQSLGALGTAFDPARAGECAATVRAAEADLQCNGPDAFYGQPNPEERTQACAFAGSGGAGAGCNGAADCASGRCRGDVDAGSGGTCEPLTVAVGMPCASSNQCTHDAYCASGLDGGIATCRYRQQNGEACGADGLGFDRAPMCRSAWCQSGVCLTMCIGAR